MKTMNVVGTSFEALAFIPVNVSPLFSTLWVWLAVAAAAFSFWLLRTSSLKTTSSSSYIRLPNPPTVITTATITTSFKVGGDEREKFDEKDEEKVVLTRGNNSKKFFTVFYEERETGNLVDDDEMDGCDDVDHQDYDEDDVVAVEEECVVIKRWGSTGSTVDMITSSLSSEYDLGWYNYQDRNVIDGSVVRMWEDEKQSGSPRGRRRRCFTGLTTHLALA